MLQEGVGQPDPATHPLDRNLKHQVEITISKLPGYGTHAESSSYLYYRSLAGHYRCNISACD